MGPITETRVVRYPGGTSDADQLAAEEPLEIRVDGDPLAVTMRTPGHDAELAAGFCLTEGVVDVPDELERAEPCTEADYGNVVLVTLAGSARARWDEQRTKARRDLYLSSSCGLCGSRTIDRIARRVPPVADGFVVSPAVLAELPAAMSQAQGVFARTGGLHAAGFFRPDGRLRLAREDVGRHNAVDKLIGALLLSGQLPAGPGVLLVSGRASFELIQKAGRAGIGFLAAVSAPSSLAVDAASRFGMTLVGFLRGDRV
ncbi:MAG TPA: formate dehydrogenase accessory sulfurtransferase FdhD, partial [Urbifossiella sp.]|nr:formate dehydrogenase accessory sulfurtransferase FdhD [Urbifossiella sp.]